jgi:hypothetical protein
MWLYPLPALISLLGYMYVFSSLGIYFILFGTLTLVVGAVVYLIAAKVQNAWPFGMGRVA